MAKKFLAEHGDEGYIPVDRMQAYHKKRTMKSHRPSAHSVSMKDGKIMDGYPSQMNIGDHISDILS